MLSQSRYHVVTYKHTLITIDNCICKHSSDYNINGACLWITSRAFDVRAQYMVPQNSLFTMLITTSVTCFQLVL